MSVRQEPQGSIGNLPGPNGWQKIIIFTVCALVLAVAVWATRSAEAAGIAATALLPLLYWLSGKPPTA